MSLIIKAYIKNLLVCFLKYCFKKFLNITEFPFIFVWDSLFHRKRIVNYNLFLMIISFYILLNFYIFQSFLKKLVLFNLLRQSFMSMGQILAYNINSILNVFNLRFWAIDKRLLFFISFFTFFWYFLCNFVNFILYF